MDSGDFGLFALLSFIASLAFMILLIVLVVLGIRWLIRATGQPGGAPGRGPADDAALAALRERFARGEIDAEEFEQRRRVLGGPPG
jgi:putative membrane protein